MASACPYRSTVQPSAWVHGSDREQGLSGQGLVRTNTDQAPVGWKGDARCPEAPEAPEGPETAKVLGCMRIWNMQARQEVYQEPLLHANIRFYPDVHGTFAAMNRQALAF